MGFFVIFILYTIMDMTPLQQESLFCFVPLKM